MNHGLDIGGNAIGASTGFTIGVAANPGVPDLDNEIRRFAYKVEAGARIRHYPAGLRHATARRPSSSASRSFRIPVIAGIWPLTSLRNAEFMKNDLRVIVPDEIMLRMQQADTPELARAEGIKHRPRDAARRAADGRRAQGAGARPSAATAAPPRYRRGAACRKHGCSPARAPLHEPHKLRGLPLATFEESLKQLEKIVAQLERGDLPLEDSLRLFEEGMRLSAQCKQELDAAGRQSADSAEAARRLDAERSLFLRNKSSNSSLFRVRQFRG